MCLEDYKRSNVNLLGGNILRRDSPYLIKKGENTAVALPICTVDGCDTGRYVLAEGKTTG